MIAIFSYGVEQAQRELNFKPHKAFKIIRNSEDLRGVYSKFTGLVELYRFYENDKVLEAYHELERLRPDLFE